MEMFGLLKGKVEGCLSIPSVSASSTGDHVWPALKTPETTVLKCAGAWMWGSC